MANDRTLKDAEKANQASPIGDTTAVILPDNGGDRFDTQFEIDPPEPFQRPSNPAFNRSTNHKTNASHDASTSPRAPVPKKRVNPLKKFLDRFSIRVSPENRDLPSPILPENDKSVDHATTSAVNANKALEPSSQDVTQNPSEVFISTTSVVPHEQADGLATDESTET
ncbi:LOW QUALITY PROTEIN: hypothetical protein CVT26_011195 [Gymnopilus dilepis]|uniref:Uncharacterized protein n=1 Tax=Gymnopilus dilepis TaxID=231916 RepID=A0A409VJW0_9AGAR|nr:LOW QUALITY PROTEIN: hypothetical protein CVT26_011195 [Gymnopilus dilepis]